MWRKMVRIGVILAFLVGAALFLYPTVSAWYTGQQNAGRIEEFEARTAQKQETAQQGMAQQGTDQQGTDQQDTDSQDVDQQDMDQPGGTEKFAGLYEEMARYNQTIFQQGQSGLKDPFSYEESSFDLQEWGVADNMFGYLVIPRMDLELPLYLGANTENMKKGAVHMSQTSIPVGGENTNAVIAAHRGWKTQPMFRDIEALQIGDLVEVRNLWDTLYYYVTEIQVIRPEEVDKVLIQDGRDMVTLITCHPYRHNYQRYVVYCERGEAPAKEQTGAGETAAEHPSRKGTDMSDVEKEKLVRVGGYVLLLAVLFYVTCRIGRRHRR